jgi:hypothetical protein
MLKVQMRVAILLAGRIKGWEYTKDSLKSLQDKYNALFFVSLNAEAPDESTNAFCQYFNVSPEQIVYIPTQTPEKYRQFHPDGKEHNFYSQWFHVRSAFDLCKSYCLQKNTMFDVVIKYRSEIKPEHVLEIGTIIPKRFYCPVHPAYQTNDQMAYGDFQTMEAYSRLVNFYEFFYENKKLLYSGGLPRPTECVLFDYLNILAYYDKIDVIYIDFKFYLDGKRNLLD